VRKALEEGLSSASQMIPLRKALAEGLGSPAKIIPFPKQKTFRRASSEG
jgi:hypothetical protein